LELNKYNRRIKMALFDELDGMFPSHTHFYQINLSTMDEALEKCARMTGELGHVFSYNGTMFMAVQHTLGNDISWLTEIEDPNPEVVEAEITVVDTKKK
jgi:hypothetical protein